MYHQLIAAAAAGIEFHQHIARQQLSYVAQRVILIAFSNCRPPITREFAVKVVKQLIEQFGLAFIDWRTSILVLASFCPPVSIGEL